MNSLITLLKQSIELPATEEIKIPKFFIERRILKNELFIRAGEVPRRFAYVHQGLFRYFYLHKKGTEFTKNFIPAGNFLTSYSAMIVQKPSIMFIEALEDSLIYEINYHDWIALRNEHPCWNALLVKMLEKAFVIKETRERELLLLDAQERYNNFNRDFPSLENKVKQHLIASYLGISPVSLSRLRNKSRH
jgi:CRP-like cAMP-binding protein